MADSGWLDIRHGEIRRKSKAGDKKKQSNVDRTQNLVHLHHYQTLKTLACVQAI